jgi:hypothetical protein
MEIETTIPDDPQEKINDIMETVENIREIMEIEAHIFIKATEKFTEEWIRREIETAIVSLENESYDNYDNPVTDNEKLNELKLSLRELPNRIPGIVEAHLNLEDYWVHRTSQLKAGVSRDYIEFKKGKMRKDLTLCIRMILGCTAEICGYLTEDASENEGWVKERGKRKYICFLRFSDEMTASLNRYFERLEELFILDHERRMK